MADHQISAGVKMSYDSNPQTLDLAGRGTQMVVLWDTGPEKPKQPKRPDTPQGKVGDPTFELAKVEFADELEQYQTALAAFRRSKKEYEDWHKKWGGPYEMFNVWSVDAADHLDRDPKRYHISSSTRGHSGKPNRGLPEGLSSGPGHAENLRRIAAGEDDLNKIRQSDPVFGKVELRQ